MKYFIERKWTQCAAIAVALLLLAVSSGAPLGAAGSTPVENLLPQGTMQGDLNAGGHNVVNAGTVRATNVIVSGSLTSPASVPLLLGPARANFIVMGDSITAGPDGLPQFASQSYAATMQELGLGLAGGTNVYDLGLPGEKIGDMLGQYSGATSTTAATTTVTTTSGINSATIGSATGVSVGMSIGAATIPPNTIITVISGTAITLSKPASANGSAVTCSIATPVADTAIGASPYPGGLGNQWNAFNNTAHQLSNAISGLPTYLLLLAGTNDIATTGDTGISMTSTNGSPNVTVTGGTFSGFTNGSVVTGANFPSALPPFIVSGGGTANLVLSSNATASGSFSATVWVPATALATAESSYTSLVSGAHGDGDTTANNGGVIALTLLPRANSTTTGGVATNVVLGEFNAWLKTGASGADYVFDTNSVLPAFGAATFSPYYYVDQLHLSFLGNAVLGRYIDQQFFAQVDPSALAWNPFAPGAMPEPWQSANIPRLAQANSFQPGGGESAGGQFSITNGSATAAITSGTTAGIYPGMYAACPGFAVGVEPNVTKVSSVTGTTVTLTNNLSATAGSIFMSFSYAPFVGAVNVQGDVIVGSANNLNGPNPCNVVFMAGQDLFSSGLIWQSTSGVGQWTVVAPTGGSGDMLIQNLNGNMKLDLNSAGTLTVTANNSTALALASSSSGGATTTFYDSSTGTGNFVFGGVGRGSGTNDSLLYGWKNVGGAGSASNYGFIGMNGDNALRVLASNAVLLAGGPLEIDAAGNGLQVKEGTNCKQGTATLSAGAATVSDTSVTTGSRILLTIQSPGGTVGAPYVSARTAGTSFTITSTSGADASTVAYEIFEPAP